MTRVTWDDTGNRTYRTGVDRGMLYVWPYSGVSWSGLTKVTLAPTGGEAKPYYLDGQKILNLPGAPDFAATIETLGMPPEFAACAGRGRLSSSLYIGDQPKRQFGFCYRSFVGNDLAGTTAGYELHLIYNATAALADVTHTTINEAASLATYSWGITAVPLQLAGMRPTAHVVFSTLKFDASVISTVEDVLYGNDEADPRLLTSDEIISILG